MAVTAPDEDIRGQDSARGRVEMLDLLRGGSMILVVIYHILYDLKFIYRLDIPRVLVPGQPEIEAVHICFLWMLFGVSGICSGFSRNSLKRGAALYILGFGITMVTAFFMPEELIVFGVISCFGACMCITSLLQPFLDKLPWQGRLIGAIVLWFILRSFHRGGEIDLIFTRLYLTFPECDFLYPIGIKGANFRSSDYFPLVPYLFMFLAGNALYKPVSERRLPGWFYKVKSGFVGFIGRHTLAIYVIHQPIILLVLGILFGT
ncbi:MAG: DUF1624 domain-containing protein, partial [Oscillospiraceae bacterium]|nr:DUF1624 domain-containing protein [Oscillospiraceae bacterium]